MKPEALRGLELEAGWGRGPEPWESRTVSLDPNKKPLT